MKKWLNIIKKCSCGLLPLYLVKGAWEAGYGCIVIVAQIRYDSENRWMLKYNTDFVPKRNRLKRVGTTSNLFLLALWSFKTIMIHE